MTAQPNLNMVRIRVDMRKFNRWSSEREISRRSKSDQGLAMHCLLSESFGKGILQPFRLMVTRFGASGSLYSYSASNATDLKDTLANTAPPEHCNVLIPGAIESKKMPIDWKSGQLLGFDIRTRPVRRSRNSNNRITERDAFQHEALKHEKGKFTKSREEVYTVWMSEQFNRHGGAKLKTARLAKFNRIRSASAETGRLSEGPDAVMCGTLKITSGDAFARLLVRGIGRRRAYGYGMLLLRPRDSAQT